MVDEKEENKQESVGMEQAVNTNSVITEANTTRPLWEGSSQ